MSSPLKKTLAALLSSILLLLGAAAAAADSKTVIVNGVRLPDEVIVALEIGYQTEIVEGRYWYDAYSGLWGRVAGPAAGQILPGLDFGAPLRENASDGDTYVIVNGRRLRSVELAALQQWVGRVQPGRYWLDPAGNAGFEGGPALVNIVAAYRQVRAARGGSNRNTPFGNWGSDGSCSYFSHPDGPSVMLGQC